MAIAKKTWINLLIGFFITFVLAGLLLFKFQPLETIEEKLYDYRFKIRGALKPPDNIVIAAIDEKSIEKLGRWPWSRDKIAKLIERLAESDAALIVSDIIFSEPEKNDEALAKAVKNAGNVILPIVFDFDRESAAPDSEPLRESAYSSIEDADAFNKYNPIKARRILTPVHSLAREAISLGHINMFPDSDGTLRWEALAIEYNGYIYPSITLKTAAYYLGIPQEMVVLKAGQGILLGNRYIKTDRWGRVLINYYGYEQTFRHISIADILEGNINVEALKNKIVLIGATAVGIYDLRVTPFSPAMPGVEKNANIIASILENRFLYSASMPANLVALLLSGIVITFAAARFKAGAASFITLLFLFFIFLSGYYLFKENGVWIGIAYPSVNVILVFICITAYNYAVEERYAKRIRAMFSNYVTEKIVSELIKNPDMARLGGERREVTVLFSDIKGFTSFSERHSPEEVVSILNEYLNEMADVIFKWEGTLDKFIGDAILAFWGAPMKQDNHAELAVKCALNMTKRLEELKSKWEKEGKPVLDCGIGINTGEVLVGNIGAEGKKMDYTVIGDHVNLGSRIESLTRKYDVHILITEFTLNKIRNIISGGSLYRISIKGLEKVIVKGKENPVEIYEIKAVEHGVPSGIIEVKGKKTVHLDEK